MADPRLGDLRDLTLVMEYHGASAPKLPAFDAARDLLEAAGFTTGYETPNPRGHGTLWAWKLTRGALASPAASMPIH